jgi:hypothetical protein
MATRDRADKEKERERGVDQPSVGEGPTQDQAREGSRGASAPQGRRSQLAANEEEMKERAEFVASSVVESIAPGRAREEANAARKRASASDPEQALVEQALADKLEEVADRHDKTVAAQAERTRIMNRSGGLPQRSASGVLGEPIPDSVTLGSTVVYHTPDGQPDTTSIVIGLWEPTLDDEDKPDGPKSRWRVNLELFPLHGSPSSIEGVPYGAGAGQFQSLDDVKEPKTVPTPDQLPFRDHATKATTA